MSRRIAWHAHKVAVGLLSGLLLSGCPLPIPPGLHHGTRENLDENVPEFIVPGVTTREDVVSTLGGADGAALDESWLSYGSVEGQGGVVFLVGGYGGVGAFGVEAVQHHRLVVFFDERGVVERTQMETRLCPKALVAAGSGSGETKPCLDFSGRDLPMIRTLQ